VRQPDSLKPVLDRLLEKIVSSFSAKDRAFYEMEFEFFKEVTGISGTLKPLVQSGATKADKKVLLTFTMRITTMKLIHIIRKKLTKSLPKLWSREAPIFPRIPKVSFWISIASLVGLCRVTPR
jgi:hypothetical protein